MGPRRNLARWGPIFLIFVVHARRSTKDKGQMTQEQETSISAI
jgi:hypothetical protein